MKKIILRLGPQAPDQCAWVKIEADGAQYIGQGSLSELAAAGAEGYRLLALIPGAEVLLTRVLLPPGNRKQLLAAVPYALEESLAAEIEEQHFALGALDEQGSLAVAVIARERLTYWRDLCRAHALEPAAIMPEILALPLPENGRAMLLTDGLALVRTGLQEGFVLEADALPLLPAMPGFESGTALILYQGDATVELPAAVEALVSERRPIGDPLPLLAEGVTEKEALNLLQGEYTPQAMWERHWRQWRRPAVLLLALLLVYTALGVGENSRLRRYSENLTAQIEQIYRQTFPSAQRVVNPRVQMEQQLKALRGEGSASTAQNFLRLLDLSGPILAAGENMRLRGLRYRAGELDLDLELNDLQALDSIKERLDGQGVIVEIQSVNTRGEQVQARLQLKEAPR